MKNKIFIITISLFFFCFFNTLAQIYSNEFLQLGIGGRALSMGNSVVASVSDIHSGYWNPSALVGMIHNGNVALMHASYFGGLAKYDYGAFAVKNNDTSAFGISIVRFGVDDIPNTLDLVDVNGNFDYSRLTSFSVADYAALLSYARELKNNLNVGGNVKIIRRIVGEFASAWGFGFDLSTNYTLNNWKLGAVLRDATTTFNAWNYNTEKFEDAYIATGNEIPSNGLEITKPRLLLGIARTFTIKQKFEFLTEVDADFTFDGKRNTLIKSSFTSIDPHLGFEFLYKKMFFIRAGIYNIQKVSNFDGTESFNVQPSVGVGIIFKNIGLDYAFTDIGNTSVALYSHVIGLKYCFDKK